MPAVSGKEYIHRIDQLKTEIWINGSRMAGAISGHPAFKGAISSQAKLYDHQVKPEMQDIMTYKSPVTGKRVGTSFLQPKTKEDLEKRRLMVQEWAQLHAGMMGRSPDYMNTILMVLNSSADLFSAEEEQCAERLRKYYEYVRENDLALTHVFVKPQKNRSSDGKQNDNIAARMVKKTEDGIVIKGARILATQAGMADELLVYPIGSSITDESFAYAFAIPCDTPGLKFYCRESFAGDSAFDHPLGSRFDEMDAVVVFDDVLVPWERVFLHGNLLVNRFLYTESSFFEHAAHQVVSKNVIKTEFIVGVIQKLIESIKIGEYQHVQEKLAEAAVALEAMRGFLHLSEKDAKPNQWGVMTPAANPLYAAVNYYPRIYPRFSDIIQLLGASGLAAIPTERDFQSEIGEDLEHYLQSSAHAGYDRVKLFRLAWDLSGSTFSGRQKLYERFFFGDPVRLAGELYRGYDRGSAKGLVEKFLEDK